MTDRATSLAGRVLAVLGVLSLLVELGLSWAVPLLRHEPYAIHAAAVLIGCLFGFVGFYLLDHRGALEGGRFVVQSAEGLLAIVRGGAKRPGDLVIGQTDSPAAHAAPAKPAASVHVDHGEGDETGEAP